MRCNVCKGTGKVWEGEFDNQEEVACDKCNRTGERKIVLTIVLWDEDNEREITSENVSVDYEKGAEAVARLVKFAEENKDY